jgi:uncharacterized protein (TIGR02246 family)
MGMVETLCATQHHRKGEEYVMRHNWMFAAIAVLSLTTSAFSQGVDQNTRQQIEKMTAAYHDNWNNHNAAGIADLYTNDGVLVTDRTDGFKKGHQEIQQYYTGIFNRVSHHDSATVDELFPLGNNAVITVGEYHLSGRGPNGPIKADGHYTAVDVLEGGTWKIRLLTAVPNPPPTPPAR